MTVDPITRSERTLIRLATPYLEVETRPTSSLERTILQELARTSHAARWTKRNSGDHGGRRSLDSSRKAARAT